MKVICINASNRPNEVPLNRWIKAGEIYTITETCKLNIQSGIIGVKLKEINIDDLSPYEYFQASRFVEYVPAPESELQEEQAQ